MADDARCVVARAIEAALCKDAGRTVGAIWNSERGRQQVMVFADAAIAAMPTALLDEAGAVILGLLPDFTGGLDPIEAEAVTRARALLAKLSRPV